jgi:hypothetical protein
MQAISAADLISPAIKRTKWFLFQPFRWSTFLKLCLVSVLTEGYGGSGFNFNIPNSYHPTAPTHKITTISNFYPSSFDVAPWVIASIAAAIIVLLGIMLVIGYLITRLRFALFYCLVFQTREIGPGWRRYDSESWRFFLLSLLVGIAFLFSMALIAIPFVLGFIRLIQAGQPDSASSFAAFFALLLPLIPIILLFVVVGISVHIILHDMMLPHIALENATAGDAWREVRTRIAMEKGGFLLFAFLRVVLPIAAAIASFVVLLIPIFILIVILGLSAAGLSGIFADATGGAKLLMILSAIVAVLVLVAAIILISICIGGPIGIAVRNFALLFYGSRYQVLGNLLSPPPQQVIAINPVAT